MYSDDLHAAVRTIQHRHALTPHAVATSARMIERRSRSATQHKQLTQAEFLRAPRKSRALHADDPGKRVEGDIHCQKALVGVLSVSVTLYLTSPLVRRQENRADTSVGT